MNKKYLTALFLISSFLFCTESFAQTVNFEDGFEDGNFTQNPAWSGDTQDFAVVDDTPNFLLQLDAASDASPSYLSTPSSKVDGVWKFYIDFRGFEPSGSNQANVFLMSDTTNLEGPVNGYAVQVGQSGDDVFHLVRYDNGSEAATVVSDTTVVDGSGGGYTVKITRDNSGNWKIEVATGYGGPLFDSGNTGADNTYTSASYFGPRVDFTSSRSDKFYFDFKIDLPPFTLADASANGKQVDVTFNRPPDQSTADAADFSINNGVGSPNSISFPSANTARLQYGSALPSNKYIVTVQNIQDQNGNAISNNASASFTVYDTYAGGDVIINEFMYDPPSGQAEYVELKNLSDKYLNLQNWQIGDDSHLASISTDSVTLAPNHFIVISSDTTALFNAYGTRPFVLSPDAPALNNGGDVVRILTDANTQVDSLRYNPGWGGANVALERRSDSAPSIYQENFDDSPNSLGGTPGQANEVASDNTPPDLQDLGVRDNQTIDLDFSERLANGPATNAGNYNLNNGIIVTGARQAAADSVRLSLSSPLQNGTSYQLRIQNQQDIFGNTTSSIDTTFSYFVVSPPDSGDLFINEFNYDPPDGSTEYVELYNPSAKSLDLNGWTINDNTGNRHTITNQRFVIPPDSFAVLAPDNSLLTDHPDINLLILGDQFPSLNNSGDAITVRDSTGKLLDSLTYTPDFGGNSVALERRTTDVPPIKANFGDAPNGFGTPGAANQVGRDTTPPGLDNFSILSGQSLQFVFSENVTEQSAANTTNYQISGNVTVNSAARFGGDTVRVSLSKPLQNNTSYTATINGVKDLFGNAITNRDTTFTYFTPSPADSGDVFINEFTYDPPEGSTEYVELYNPSPKSLDLQNWTINDNTGDLNTITSNQHIIPPNSYVVLAPDRTLLEDHPDIDLIALGSRFPSLNNSGDAITLRRADGLRLDSLTYTRAFGGNNLALERRTMQAPPVQANFGDAPNGFGTPGATNQISQDNTPPNLASFAIPDNKTLTLAFTETLSNKTATKAGNYSLGRNIKVNGARQTAGDSVQLSLSSPLQNGTSYRLSISNEQDIFGNTAAEIDTTFTYLNASRVDSGDVFINEFTYDPPTGSTEYVELYNASSKSLNLKGWTINDNTGNRQTIISNRFVIPPNSYAVLAPDRTVQRDRPDITLIPLGSRFPSLNNSGDAIVLRRADGLRLDSLTYTPAFGGDNLALERRTTLATPVQANFGDAPNGFGTPGMANQIGKDITPPRFQALNIVNNTELQLIFSEAVTPGSATDKSNYSVSPNTGIDFIASGQDTVDLILSQKLQSGTNYTVTVSGVQDVFGNTLASSTSKTATYVIISTAQPKDVVINEFLYQPKPGGAEFVELYNRSGRNVKLSGWKLGDASAPVTINAATQLQSGNYLVLTDNKSLADQLGNAGLYLSDFPALNNDGDAIYIKNAKGVTIDSLFYSARFGGNVDGQSAERKDPDAASNDPANFATSKASPGSTPAAKNSVFAPDKTAPEISSARILANGNIEVHFNEFIKLTDDLEFKLNDRELKVVSFSPDEANAINLSAAGGVSTDTKLLLQVKNLADVSGNITSSTSISIAQQIQKGQVVINEILYDPINDSEDNKPDQSEYIELRNTEDYAVSLEGIRLHDAPDEDGTVRTIEPVTTQSKFIPAGGTALIYAEDETAVFDRSRIARFFELSALSANSLLRADRSTLSLASSGDAIYVADKNGATIDSVFYDESWQNPNLADTKGVALERINPNGPSNNKSNWSSSVDELGGTPDQENSIFSEPEPGEQQKVGINISPNPFSPDGDSRDPVTYINYKLDASDYLITINIYDRYGRKIRKLVDGKQAGFKGSIPWNGLKDDGTRNRIGIYIVIFKAFDSANGKDLAFKKTVVLARKLN